MCKKQKFNRIRNKKAKEMLFRSEIFCPYPANTIQSPLMVPKTMKRVLFPIIYDWLSERCANYETKENGLHFLLATNIYNFMSNPALDCRSCLQKASRHYCVASLPTLLSFKSHQSSSDRSIRLSNSLLPRKNSYSPMHPVNWAGADLVLYSYG